MRILFFAILFFNIAFTAIAQNVSKPAVPTQYASFIAPPGFIKNNGQVHDLDHKMAQNVLYSIWMGNTGIFITGNGISYLTCKHNYDKFGKDSVKTPVYDLERVDVTLTNSRISERNIIEDTYEDDAASYVYYTGNEVLDNNIHKACKQITIQNIYKGIDWVIAVDADKNGRHLKYSFIVRPGADAAKIQMHYSGNASLLTDGDNIRATSLLNTFIEKKPFAFIDTQNIPVPVIFSLHKNNVGFTVQQYDKSKTLIIDPEVYWSTYLSSVNPDISSQYVYGRDVKTDAHNNVYVALDCTNRVDFPVLNPGGGAYYKDFSSTTTSSLILMKFNETGKLLWSTYFGADSPLSANCITIDANENLIALAQFGSTTASIPIINNGGYSDAAQKKNIILKFNNNGILTWSTYFLNTKYVNDIAADNAGNFYIAGGSGNRIASDNFPIVDPGGGAYISPPAFNYSAFFISRFNAANQLTWSTQIDTSATTGIDAIRTDKKGNVYIIGYVFAAKNYPYKDAGGYFNKSNTGNIITKFTANGNMVWSTNYNTVKSLSGITLDDSCNLYVLDLKGLTKFNEATQLVWTQAFNPSDIYYNQHIVYDRKYQRLHILGSLIKDYQFYNTLNTKCNSSFYYSNKSAFTYPITKCPIFSTYNTDGSIFYSSLADWPVADYSTNNAISVDSNGDLVYLFGNIQAAIPATDVINPGNGAFYQPKPNIDGNSGLLFKLTFPPAIDVNPIINTPANCNTCNGSIALDTLCGKSPLSFLWSTGETTSSIKNLCPGDYSVKVTDADNFFITENINVPYPAGFNGSFETKITGTNCGQLNGAVTISNVTGGIPPYTYALNNSSFTTQDKYTGIDSGIYIVSVKDATGCVKKDTILIPGISGPQQIFLSVKDAGCNKASGSITTDSIHGGIVPYAFILNNSQTSSTGFYNNLYAGQYSLQVKDNAGCSLTQNINIKDIPAADSARLLLGDEHCNQADGFINISAVYGGTSPFTFSIDGINFTNSMQVKNLAAAPYNLTIKDANGCLSTESFIIDSVRAPGKIYFHQKDAVCGAKTGTLFTDSVQNGSSPYTYSINNAAFTNQTVHTNLLPGKYDIIANDNFNCTTSDSFIIIYQRSPVITISPADTTICADEMVTVHLLIDSPQLVQDLAWNTAGETGYDITLKGDMDKLVIATVSDIDNCIFNDTASIKIKACNPPNKCMLVPSAFTPNGDGHNDMIGPIINGCIIHTLSFKIFNRFGQLIFETKDVNKKWDGNLNALPQAAGTYIYLCEYAGEDNISLVQRGTIVLIR